MALSKAGITKFFGRSASDAAGFAFGHAAAPALAPPIQELVNQAWHLAPFKVVDVMTLAEGVAQRQVNRDWATDEAQRNGFDSDRFDRMVAIANVGPGAAAAMDLWRRNVIDEADFRRAVGRIGIEQEWIDDLVNLHNVLLSVSEIANAVQQGHMPNEGVLPNIDPSVIFPPGYDQPPAPDGAGPSHVPLTQIPISPVDEAAASGHTLQRLEVLANLAGLPPGPEAILDMWNRNLIDEATVDAGIREGHMKTKWAHAFKRMRWHVLSAPEYAGLWLRGWISKAEAIRGGALTGTTPAQMDLLYKNRGRPMAPVQAFTAWARKAPHPVGEGIPDRAGTFDFRDFKRAIQQSDIRTEYVEPLWAIRYAYPPLFQINRLRQANAIDTATAVDWAEKQRYAPEVISALTAYWNQGTGDGLDPHVARSENHMWTTLHTSFLNGETNVTDARRYLQFMLITGNSQDQIITFWQRERELIRKQLTPAQIKKAYLKPVRNPATGANWTRDDALAALIARGYTANDANVYLDE